MDPYYRKLVDAYAASGRPSFHQLSPDEAREMVRATLAAAPPPVGLLNLSRVVNETIDGPHGPLPIRRYLPHDARGTCVYFHAGGWVIGDLDQADTVCRRLAAAARCEIVNVDYRLAPEHPFPQPLDDAYAAVLWAAANRPGPLLVAGESAGGNLAAVCAIRARDTGGPALAGQFLAYPVTDARFDTPSYLEAGNGGFLLSRADMEWFWDHYCPANVDRAQPLVSPLRIGDAAGLPPTFLCVGELDPLRDEGLAYGERLAAAGVSVTIRRDADMLHGYLAAAGTIDTSTQALAQAAEWIATHIRTAAAADEPQYGESIAG